MMLRCLILLSAALAAAQSQNFEVASVKPSGQNSVRGSEGGPGSSDPGRYSYHKGSLDDLIATAFHVDYRQIASKTPLDKQDFDFDAKLPPGATREQMRVMLQNFLAERFHMKHHIESREFSGYELVVTKGGPRLLAEGTAPEHLEGFPDLIMTRPDMRSVHTRSGSGGILVHMRGRLRTTKQLAEWLEMQAEGPVADKTGLSGKYDFALEYGVERTTASPDAAPSAVPDFFTAVKQQLGLQLVPKKIALDVVVVDSIDKMPTEN